MEKIQMEAFSTWRNAKHKQKNSNRKTGFINVTHAPKWSDSIFFADIFFYRRHEISELGQSENLMSSPRSIFCLPSKNTSSKGWIRQRRSLWEKAI